MSQVPTIAIDLVEIEESKCFVKHELLLSHGLTWSLPVSSDTSMLADEFIAHRLGLLPLVSHRALDTDFELAFR